MGQNESQSSSKFEKINKNYFSFHYVIGRGGFGKVWKVSYKKTNTVYALKEMSKVKIIDRKSEKSIISERSLLSRLHHPFLVNMIYSFQDYDYLYLVMDYLSGGDLRYHICRNRTFTEMETKFFMACIILGLEYIHSNNIIHRDIKPENLVCDEKGYIHITDFGVAKKHHKNNGEETSGTPGYMAPEVLCGKNHSYPVDYFALGVIGYEFMLGERPYLGKGRKEIKQAVLAKQVQIKSHEIPYGWTFEAADFINKLIQRKVSNRLGSNGIQDIKAHPWFAGFNWDDLYNKKMMSPFVPDSGDNFDKRYCESDDKNGETTLNRYQVYRKNENYSSLFRNYTFNNIPEEEFRRLSSMSTVSTTNISTKKTSNTLKESIRDLMKNNINSKPKKKEHQKKFSNPSIKIKGNLEKNFSLQKFKLTKGFFSPSSKNSRSKINERNLPRIDSKMTRSSSTINLMPPQKKPTYNQSKISFIERGFFSPQKYQIKFPTRKLSVNNSIIMPHSTRDKHSKY